ncbi:fibropellin-3-like, partial [Oscarella lobularis]|uniref:fibropellin-3-like n=1 Tax=Oscarella lobularis TaxID=121494 RepID=UPI0033135B29
IWNGKVCFNCSTGFQLIGDSCVACKANATWSGNEPHCIVIDCPNLLPLANCHILSGESSVEGLDVVKFDCNDGYELNGLWNITCLSSGNWSGDQPECQNIDECECMPCRNGGSCTDGINAFSCECLPGYGGENCETDLNECESMPCLNGGNCTDLVADYSCACLSGYTGSDCETNIDECASWPCENNGTCIDGIDGYSCDCVIGYTGNTCETNVNDHMRLESLPE